MVTLTDSAQRLFWTTYTIGSFMAYRSVVVARELALLEQDACPLFEGAALEHIGVKPFQGLCVERLCSVSLPVCIGGGGLSRLSWSCGAALFSLSCHFPCLGT